MLNRIITIAIFSTIFISSYVLFKEPFEFYLPYLFVVLLLPLFALKFPFPRQIIPLMLFLLLFGLINIWSGENTYPFFLKIYINILISILFYYYVFEAYQLDVKLLFSFYMKGALIVSVIGLIQFISFKIGFEYGYNLKLYGLNKWGVIRGGSLGIRINSVFSEPSYFGATIAPAVFIALYNLIKNQKNYLSKTQSVIIIIVYLLTFSSVAYLGVFLVLMLMLLNFGFVRYVVIFLPIILGGYMYLYYNVSEFRERIEGMDALYENKAKSAFEVHGSSFVQFNNMHVASTNFLKNPLFGTGLGSHQIAYGKYSLVKQYGGINDFNSQDANSMFLRLMSETGLFGLIFIVLFIIKFFVFRKNDHTDKELWLISNAVLVLILLQLFRQGNYTYSGFMFFMWMYYFVKQEVLKAEEKTLLTNELNKVE
jgi:hypothetical protein